MTSFPQRLAAFVALWCVASFPLFVDAANASREDQVTITKWSGRTGNNILQVTHAIAYAKRVGASQVVFPGFDENSYSFLQLFSHPSVLRLPTSAQPAEGQEAPGCSNKEDMNPSGMWYQGKNVVCKGTTFMELRQVLFEHIRPMFRAALSQCEMKPEDEHAAERLTIHLRSGDLFSERAGHKQHKQPPCKFYDKVIETGLDGKPFSKVLVVTENERTNPCLSLLLERHPDIVEVQSGTVLEDACSLLRARNLVTSFSTFSHMLGRMSTRLLRVYGSDPLLCGDWMGPVEQEAWPGVRLNVYQVPGQHAVRDDVNENTQWMKEYSGEVFGPGLCESQKWVTHQPTRRERFGKNWRAYASQAGSLGRAGGA